MAWQEVGGGTYISYADREPGDILVEGAWFLRPVEGQFEKPNYEFMQQDGSKVILNGCGYVHNAMNDIEPGDFCRIVYGGQGITSKKSKYKDKTQHIVKVMVNPDQQGIVRGGVFIGLSPKREAPTNVAPVAQTAKPEPAAAPEPEPEPEPESSDDLDW